MSEKNTNSYPKWKNGKILFKGVELTEEEAFNLVQRMDYRDKSIDKQMEIDILVQLCGFSKEEAIKIAEMP